MTETHLIWGIGSLSVLSVFLWTLAPDYRTRVRYAWLLLIVCWALVLIPARQPWTADVSIALAELVAVHLCTAILFRLVLHRVHIPLIVTDIVVIAGYFVVVLNLLARLGVNVSGIIATSAVVAAVVGLALQELLVNLISGLSIHAEGSIHKGVWIKSEHGIGEVVNVRLRHTIILTPENDHVLLPNHALVKSPVTILSKHHRCTVRFRLGAEHRPTSVIEAVETGLRSTPMHGIAVSPKPQCLLLEYQNQHVEYAVHAWVTTPGHSDRPLTEVLTRLYFVLDRAGFPLGSIPNFHTMVRLEPHHPQEKQLQAIEILEKIPIWRTLTRQELELLGSRLRHLTFAPGESIVEQGQIGESMYVILKGSVSVTYTSATGQSEQLATLEPGSFFGEMSLMTGDRRSASVIALEEVQCGELEKEDIADILMARPELAQEISAILDRRQTELASIRKKLHNQPAPTGGPDLLSMIQEFFGIGSAQNMKAKDRSVANRPV